MSSGAIPDRGRGPHSAGAAVRLRACWVRCSIWLGLGQPHAQQAAEAVAAIPAIPCPHRECPQSYREPGTTGAGTSLGLGWVMTLCGPEELLPSQRQLGAVTRLFSEATGPLTCPPANLPEGTEPGLACPGQCPDSWQSLIQPLTLTPWARNKDRFIGKRKHSRATEPQPSLVDLTV